MTGEDKIEIRIARTVADVEALREVWTQWPGQCESDIDFYLMVLAAYPRAPRPYVMVLYRNGSPDAILIARLEKKELNFGVGYLRALHAQSVCLTAPHDALRGNATPENCQLLIREIMNCLRRGEADVAALEFIPLTSPLYDFALHLPNVLCRDTFPAAEEYFTLTVPDSIEGLYQRLSVARRKGLKRKAKGLREYAAGSVKIVCYRHESELEAVFRDAEKIACRTYQRGLGAGFVDNREVRMRLSLGARKGWLRAYFLYVRGEPAAFWIGFLYDATFGMEYTGYDQKFQKFSPGMALLMHIIETFCDGDTGDIVKRVDFGFGHAQYKAAICDKTRLQSRVYIFAPTLTGAALKLMRTSSRILAEAAKNLLLTTGLLPKVKKIWRDRLAKRAAVFSEHQRSCSDGARV